MLVESRFAQMAEGWTERIIIMLALETSSDMAATFCYSTCTAQFLLIIIIIIQLHVVVKVKTNAPSRHGTAPYTTHEQSSLAMLITRTCGVTMLHEHPLYSAFN